MSLNVVGFKFHEHKANGLVKQFLAEYQPPPMDDAIREELTDFVARRTAEGGVPVDY